MLHKELGAKLKALTDNFAEAYTAGKLEQAQKLLGDMNFYKQQQDQVREIQSNMGKL